MKNKGRILLLGVFTLLLVACGKETTASNATEDIETITIEDAVGNTVEVPLNPETVAVFDNGQLDNLNSLGLGDRVVLTASPNMPDHLSEFSDVETAGSFFEIDLEVTNATDPDLIIVAGRSSSAYDDLSSIAPTLDLSNDSQAYMKSVESNLEKLGQLFEIEDKATELTSQLEEELESLKEKAENSEKNTLMVMFNEGSLSAYGSGSRFGVIYDAFGFRSVDESIESSNHGMDISYEYVLTQNPDTVFVLDRTAAIGGDVTSEELETNPIIKETEAFKNDSFYYLSPSAWYLSEGGAETFRIMINEVSQALSK